MATEKLADLTAAELAAAAGLGIAPADYAAAKIAPPTSTPEEIRAAQADALRRLAVTSPAAERAALLDRAAAIEKETP